MLGAYSFSRLTIQRSKRNLTTIYFIEFSNNRLNATLPITKETTFSHSSRWKRVERMSQGSISKPHQNQHDRRCNFPGTSLAALGFVYWDACSNSFTPLLCWSSDFRYTSRYLKFLLPVTMPTHSGLLEVEKSPFPSYMKDGDILLIVTSE